MGGIKRKFKIWLSDNCIETRALWEKYWDRLELSSLRELSERIGVPLSTLWRWRRGAKPRKRNLEKIKAFLRSDSETNKLHKKAG